jgi:hypothetical protein
MMHYFLIMSLLKQFQDICICIINFPLQPNRVADGVYSPLVKACIGGSLECVKLLVEVHLFT